MASDLTGETPALSLDTAFGLRYGRCPDSWSATLQIGPWSADASGRVQLGPLAVLMDIATAMPQFFARTDPHVSPVSVAIEIAFPPGDPPFGLLRAEGEVVGADSSGSLATGRIVNEAGMPVAVGTMVGSYAFLPESWDGYKQISTEEFDPSLSLPTIFGGEPEETETGATHVVRVDPWLANPRSGFHGGVAAALVDYVALRALRGGSDAWTTAALRVDYLAPAGLGATIVFRAERVRQGSSFAVVRGEGATAEGRRIVTALATYRRR